MSRAPVLRRNFSLFNRVPYSRIARSAARDGHEVVIVQRVRIRKPIFSKARIVGTLAIAGAAYGLSRYIDIRFEIQQAEENKNKITRPNDSKPDTEDGAETGQDVDDEDDYEVLLFLPTGLSRPKPRTLYRGSDPEWQEFKRLATDAPRVQRIRNELVTMIRAYVAKNPQYVTRLGRIDNNKGKLWVEFKFPDGPPVEYERPGLELTEELGWRRTTRPVEDKHHQRLKRVLFPSTVAAVLYNDTKKKIESSWKNFRVYLGLEEKTEPETVQQLVQRLGVNKSSPRSPAPPSTSTTSSPPSTSPSNDTQHRATSPSAALAKELGLVLPDPKKLTLDLSQFRQDFRKAQKPYDLATPRGAVLVLGLIDVYGDRARMTLNVAAAYDPKQGRYVSIRATVWNFVELRQHPKGGP